MKNAVRRTRANGFDYGCLQGLFLERSVGFYSRDVMADDQDIYVDC